MHKPSNISQILSQAFLAIVGVYVILPIWGVMRLAFDGSLLGRATEFRLLPKVFSIASVGKVLDQPYQSVDFVILLKNSLVVSIGAALMAIVLGGTLAYAIARFRFPGRKTGLFIILLTAILPPITFATPLYIVLSALKLRTTIIGLIIVYAAFALPFCIWNMRAGFQSVSKELEEAAFLDGADNWVTFINISLPLTMPSIFLAGLIAFLMAYSEFAIGWLFVEKASMVTLSMAIYAMVQTGNAQPWSMLGSLIILMSLPVVVLFILFQNVIFKRMMFGSLKD